MTIFHEDIPFYVNFDDNHCFQAALRMVIAHFESKELPWKELEAMTGYEPKKWTWTIAGALAMAKRGYGVVLHSLFGLARFANNGEKYLFEYFSESTARSFMENCSDIKRAQEASEEVIGIVRKVQEKPLYKDLASYLSQKFLLICNMNSHTITGKLGFTGHSIVVYKADNENAWLHDPGLPTRESDQGQKGRFYESLGI